jgi:hypothetical protein
MNALNAAVQAQAAKVAGDGGITVTTASASDATG